MQMEHFCRGIVPCLPCHIFTHYITFTVSVISLISSKIKTKNYTLLMFTLQAIQSNKITKKMESYIRNQAIGLGEKYDKAIGLMQIYSNVSGFSSIGFT